MGGASGISFKRMEITMESTQVHHHGAWNKGKLIGQKAPVKLKEIWGMLKALVT